MATWEHKDGSGTLFKNKNKEKDTQPDMRGEAMIGGTVYELAGWKKQTKAGDVFLSLAVKPKEERVKEQPKQSSAQDMDSDVPF